MTNAVQGEESAPASISSPRWAARARCCLSTARRSRPSSTVSRAAGTSPPSSRTSTSSASRLLRTTRLGLAVTTDMLDGHPDVTGIFGMNDPSALGAVLAVEQADKASQIKVTGVDGSPEAVAEL